MGDMSDSMGEPAFISPHRINNKATKFVPCVEPCNLVLYSVDCEV